MSIAEFIRESVLRPRVEQAGVLVVYDADQRYREVCFELAARNVRVIDASVSSIESREAALVALRDLVVTPAAGQGILIYVPHPRPEGEEQKQVDPFSIYTEAGAIFPQDDGDAYLSLCLRARPDHATEIRQLFASSPGGPSFAVIDAIGNGTSWPQLRAALRVDSGREILHALLAPTASQAESLKEQEGWMAEAREFLRATLGMDVKTRAKSWGGLAPELWRYLLFSEFVFDLPVELPAALGGVPRAVPEARPIVEDVCDRLRSDPRSRANYIERSTEIEQELNLIDHCRTIEDLGEKDTFPFEERTFLAMAIRGVMGGDTDATRRVLDRQQHSVWLEKGESKAQWDLVQASLRLIEVCADAERQLPDHARTQAELIDFYLTSLREVDRLQREFEQALGDIFDEGEWGMAEMVALCRATYRRLVEKVQNLFIRHLETGGWPPAGRLANADIFDRLVAERLKEKGRRVAYFMVDALRYELGVALEKLLAEDGPVELQAAYAQLPTITVVGMASLLPGARAGLTLSVENEVFVPRLDGAPVGNVAQRMNVLAKRYGDRFAEMPLSDFARTKPKIAETVELLVLRSTEIDSQLESNSETTLGLIPKTLKQIRVALHKLRGLGFTEAVIVTDHGFFLNAQAEAGDVCVKPQGNWVVNAHDRFLLGDGSVDSHSLMIGAERVGIRGGGWKAAFPRSMAPYRNGYRYFHGGVSLAEAVVPVLVARLDAAGTAETDKLSIILRYKNGAKRITTRLPIIDIEVDSDLFTQGVAVEVLLEAQDGKGSVVGEPRQGNDVDPATRTVTLMKGQRKQIPLRMDDDFRGKFTVKALNPTTLIVYANISLETDYTE